jgi:predicted histidine transporter YuiF (NhaC family)
VTRRGAAPAALLVAATAVFALGITLERREEGHHGGEEAESILGIKPESTPLVVLAVVISLLVALAVWRRSSSSSVVWTAVVFCAAFTVMDVLEVARKLHTDESGIAALAAVVAVLHVAAGLAALGLLRGARAAAAA